MTVDISDLMLTKVAEFADLTLSDKELESFAQMLTGMMTTIRSTPNNAVDGIEPANIFRVFPSKTFSENVNAHTEVSSSEVHTDDLAYMTAAEASGLIKSKKLSPVDLTKAILKQVEQVNPRVEAFVTLLQEQVLAEAALAEKEVVSGSWRGPLHGIPLALKDIIETKGIRTTASSRVLSDYIPQNQAAVAEKLAAAGSILVGKVHTHEFAMGMMTPTTRNPYDLECTPGGSSGGSGAAVASGMATMAIGTDTGGSIRIPAAFCGIVGLKPTYGRVSRRGIFSLSWSLDHAGPMTRSVEDAALMLQAIAGYDPLDGASAPVPVPDYRASLKSGVKGLKIGICRGIHFENAQPDVQLAVAEAANVLGSLGAELIDVEIPNMAELSTIGFLIAMAEVSSFHQKWLRNNAQLYNDDVRTFLQMGELVLATDYLQAQRRRTVFNRGLQELLNRVDLLLLPSQPVVAPKMGQTEITYPGFSGTVMEALGSFNSPFNVSGLPSISVPCGFSEGLPIGLQLAGRPFEEGLILQAAYAFEQATEWHNSRPNIL